MLASRVLPAPVTMHITDGLISLGVSRGCWVIAATGVGVALWRSREALGERQVP